MSGFNMAQQPEILHGFNKDNEMIYALRQKVLDVCDKTIPQQVSRYAHWLNAGSSLLYYASNSMRLQQTLGEEYAYLRQYNDRDHVYISRKRLFLYVLIETFGEAVIMRHIGKIVDKWIGKHVDVEEGKRTSAVKRVVAAIARSVGDWQSVLGNILKVHTGVFYLSGNYYSIAKRLAGIKYMQTVKIEAHGFNYRRIGLLMMFQLSLSLVVFLYKMYREYRNIVHIETREKKEEEDDGDLKDEKMTEGKENKKKSKVKCGICFEKLTSPSVIPCGHVYCWDCIMRSSQFKSECPGCRKAFDPKEIVFLSNLKI